MALYENVFIVRQDVSSQQVEDITKRFTEIIGEGGGTVTKNDYWGLRSLTFRIKKNRKGHYVLLNLDTPSAALKEMERNMGLHEDVIRHLTVRVEELEEGPSAILRNKGSREDRPRGERRGGRGFRDDDDSYGDRGDRGDRTPAAVAVEAEGDAA